MESITSLNLDNKVVIVRVDYNVPVSNGKITDFTRIIASKRTIDYLLNKDCKIILIAHLGRPENYQEDLSFEKLVLQIEEKLEHRVNFIKGKLNQEAVEKIKSSQNHSIIFLDNIRFNEGELTGDDVFAKKLASLADVFINDAFSVSHRKDCSIYKLPALLPKACGFSLRDEIDNLTKLVLSAKKPLSTIVGGAKISSKISLIKSLIDISDFLFIAGAMSNNFLKNRGYNIGKSLYEHDCLEIANQIEKEAKLAKVELMLPIDVVVSKSDSVFDQTSIKNIEDVEDDDYIFDIGPKTLEEWFKKLQTSNTILFNGPVGKFEIKEFSVGTRKLLEYIAMQKDAISILGGGDTLASISLFNLQNKFSFVSTGGGAFLEWIEKKGRLPSLIPFLK